MKIKYNGYIITPESLRDLQARAIMFHTLDPLMRVEYRVENTAYREATGEAEDVLLLLRVDGDYPGGFLVAYFPDDLREHLVAVLSEPEIVLERREHTHLADLLREISHRVTDPWDGLDDRAILVAPKGNEYTAYIAQVTEDVFEPDNLLYLQRIYAA